MWAAWAVGKNAALFVMCMNADLWPLQWPLQPPCKFTRGSESPCASSDTVLMEAPNPISPNSGVRHQQMHAKQINKICSGCVDASSPNISWWMMLGSWILGSTATKKPSWLKNINCILMCEWNLNLSATIIKNWTPFLQWSIISGYSRSQNLGFTASAARLGSSLFLQQMWLIHHMSYHMLLT